MKAFHFHFGLSFLIFFIVCYGETSLLKKRVVILQNNLESQWASSPAQFLLGPLNYLAKLPIINKLRRLIRFAVSTIIKLPYKGLVTAIDFVCDKLLTHGLIGKSGLVKKDDISIALIDIEGGDAFSFTSKELLDTSNKFKQNQSLTVYIPGWTTGKNELFDESASEVINAYNQRNDVNFAVLQYHDVLADLYIWAAYNTRDIGNFLGIYLSKLTDKIPGKNIHLIGSGLGAHIAGFAAKQYKARTDVAIGRVTGLDPAVFCFRKTGYLPGLQKTDGKFVDIIHSSKIFGSFKTKGHADFFVNRVSRKLPRSGCKNFFCLQKLATFYYAESVEPHHEGNFCGLSCPSRNKFESGQCAGNEEVIMGLKVPLYARGSYYLNANRQYPYGQCNGKLLEPSPELTESPEGIFTENFSSNDSTTV